MAHQQAYEDKGKVQPKPEQEPQTPQKEEGSVNIGDLKGDISANTLKRMQQTVGNAAVQRFLAQRRGEDSSEVDEETSSTINAKRGSGHSLDPHIAQKASDTLGHDFGDVNVHTDSHSDTLSRQLGAKAFTTGKDIFFREGAYDPGSSEGQSLISHELTHVVQQSGNTEPGQGKMTVNDPNDQYESEADQVADTIMSQPDDISSNAPSDSEKELQMQAEPEEEEEEALQAKPISDSGISRQLPEEEEMEVQTKLQLQDEREDEQLARQEVPEDEGEEYVMTKLQRQEEFPEDELI